MNEMKSVVLEEQLDALAERVSTLTNQVTALLALLSKPAVMERVGVDKFDIRHIQEHVRATQASYSHRDQRRSRIRDREREADLNDMIREFRRQKHEV
jgi:exonuclease V gamma subunit